MTMDCGTSVFENHEHAEVANYHILDNSRTEKLFWAMKRYCYDWHAIIDFLRSES
jgi:hypothetical protein